MMRQEISTQDSALSTQHSALRLLYVIPYFAPAWAYGGPPRVTFDLARHLVRRGHAVEVLTTDAFDQENRLADWTACRDGVSVQRNPNLSNRLAWNHKIFLPLSFRPTFKRALANADVAHLFSFRTYQNAMAVGALHRRGVPYVVSAFGELPRATGPKRLLKQLYDVAYGYRILLGADALLAQTEEEAYWYRRFAARDDRIHVVPLAVDLEALADLPARGGYRHQLGIPSSEVLVLFLGRIHAYKGLELLIRAFAEVRSDCDGVRLAIAGRDDGYLAAAQALAARVAPAGSVLFPGPVYGRERFAAYRDADIFAITPSHHEQTSLAALEACACGTPVLVTEQAPIPGLDGAGAGITVPYEQAAVREALTRLVEAAEERRRMGERAAQLVRERFSWSVVASRLEGIYEDARAARAARRRAGGRR
ncbi:MAG: glycosyltransferase [Chloroflexi bacterium]|nr:glycosyltransferase [Chloroflexota bacterium]